MQMQGELELELELPPGFRFHPTDDELVNHYLCRKCAAQSIAVPIIKEIDLYKFDPWHLPGKIEKYDNSVSVDQKAPPPQQIKNDMYNQIDFRNSQLLYQIDSSDYSSCSVSPDVNKEVQSEPKWNELELELGPAFDFHFNFMDNNDDINMPSDDDPFAPPFQINHPSPFQDILMFFQHS
ncbi:hypothetical protein RIF29_42497 [Crotalaria pallida]|uniref:NAC domain-containing protein n=1 Tax=Crotalaria pallida TaxID=3830 RepID=A0AAN9E7N8_CROPI